MKWVFNKFILLTFIAITAMPFTAFSANQCRSLFSATIDKVVIADEKFDVEVDDLRATLSGKLATVWRSEWKTKLTVFSSNEYVLSIINHFLTPKTRNYVLKGLDIKSDGFTREVHARLYDLQLRKKLIEGDDLAVRDKPAPAGAKDTTFTYYTKPIVMSKREGKHQVRLRTYLREISYEKLNIGEAVQGYDMKGNLVTFTRLNSDTLKLEVGSEQNAGPAQILNFNDVVKIYGTTATLYAPHGKSFKMEIKTALEDQISNEEFPRLGGKHMVQKLDIGQNWSELSSLFAPFKNENADHTAGSIRRINKLMKELTLKNPANKSRIEAVLNVLKDGLRSDPNFLKVVGATVYHRTAFETTTGLQTTIDRDQGVYADNMYTENSLKSPMQTVASNALIKTSEKDARHVELKVPVTSMAKSVGIRFTNPETAPTPQDNVNYDKIKDMVDVYHRFVKDNLHSGKFNYIRKNGLDDIQP